MFYPAGRQSREVEVPFKDSGERNRKLNGKSSSPGGLPPNARAFVPRPSSERPSLPNPDESRLTSTVEPSRLRLILQRLRNDFYNAPPASEQIAASVLAELNDLEESPPVLPR